MEQGDPLRQSEAQPGVAAPAASRLVRPEKGLGDLLDDLRRDAAAVVRNGDHPLPGGYRDVLCPGAAGVVHQVDEHAGDEVGVHGEAFPAFDEAEGLV